MKHIIVFTIIILVFSLTLLAPISAQAVWNCVCPGQTSCGSFSTQADCVSHRNLPTTCGASVGQCSETTSSNNSGGDTDGVALQDPLGGRTLPIIIGDAIKTGLGVIGAIALALFVYGGFVWMTAGGNAPRVQKGREILVWATVGLIVIFTSYTLLQFVFKVLQ